MEMGTLINVKNKVQSDVGESGYENVKKYLPSALVRELDKKMYELSLIKTEMRLEEIRLRKDRQAYLTVGGCGAKQNIMLDFKVSSEDMSLSLEKMCKSSLYAYGESITKGYISLEGGVRVGICGRASVSEGKILGVYNIQSLNFRLPCNFAKAPVGLLEKIKKEVKKGGGVLIYSPPAEGKTTLLRSVARFLSSGLSPMRVAIVDTREELCGGVDAASASSDILSAYPQAEGIRIATAFMNPEVIICDEIGSEADALAIANAQNCGVPLIASTHGASLSGIMKRAGIKFLHESGAFGMYIGIRISSKNGFEYNIQSSKEVRLADGAWNFTSAL